MTVRFALLGAGRIGKVHARAITGNPDARLVAVADAVPAAAEAVAAQYGAEVRTIEAIEAADDIDAVVVCTPTDTHADLIERFARAGKAVFCEKPIDLDLARVERCRAAVAGKGVPIQLGFNRRFDPGHRAARDAAASGGIGTLHQVIITSRDPEMPPRSYYEVAGGLFRDMTIHDFDLARFMLGDEPVEVFAVGGRLIDPKMMTELDDHDSAMIIMRTADGKQCCINNSRTAVYGYDQRVELLGSKGMVISGNRRPHEATRYGATETGVAQPYLFFFVERYVEAFKAEIEAFVTAVETGAEPEVGFEDGRRALILAEAAYRSLAEGRMVRVDEIA
jgi:myo-inositol 2-dehydrogenase/D-chiro-inositol 1-dehydrogenase